MKTGKRRGRGLRALGIVLAALLILAVIIRASPSLSASARSYAALVVEITGYINDFFTNPNFVANVPMRYTFLGIAEGVPDVEARESRLRVAKGFELAVYAEGIPHPRMLHFMPTGELLVSQPRKGRVLLLSDADGDHRSDTSRVLLEGLELPHGLEIIGDWLYVGELEGIRRWRLDVDAGAVVGEPERIVSLARSKNHNLRSLRMGPDGWLYVSVGASCNRCEAAGPREQVLLRVRPDGTGEEQVAAGFRNVVGFDWRPADQALYANDIGADFLGEDFPPEEMNRIEMGGFYGFPYAHGAGVPDPEFGAGNEARIDAGTAPVHSFDPHSTPLGMTFLRGESIPPDYRGAALVALHGSWNRTKKTGYKVVSLHWESDGRIEERDFVAGFEHEEDVIGRPVDIIEGPDGAIYFSDDYAGAIYRMEPGGG